MTDKKIWAWTITQKQNRHLWFKNNNIMELWANFSLKWLWGHMFLTDAVSPILSPWFVGNCYDGVWVFPEWMLKINHIQNNSRKHLLNNIQRNTSDLLINHNKKLKNSIHRGTNSYWIIAVLSGGWWDSHQPLHKPDSFVGHINRSHWNLIISSVTQHRIWVRIMCKIILSPPKIHLEISEYSHLESHIKTDFYKPYL